MNDGFSLVELVVVIAILAILAGVAVPAYSGYMARAQERATLTEMKGIETAAKAAAAIRGTALLRIEVDDDGVASAFIADGGDPDEEDDVLDIDDFYNTQTHRVEGGWIWTSDGGWVKMEENK